MGGFFLGPDALPDSDARDHHHPFPLNVSPPPYSRRPLCAGEKPGVGVGFTGPGTRHGLGGHCTGTPPRPNTIIFLFSVFCLQLVLRGDLMRRFVLSCLVLSCGHL